MQDEALFSGVFSPFFLHSQFVDKQSLSETSFVVFFVNVAHNFKCEMKNQMMHSSSRVVIVVPVFSFPVISNNRQR